MDKRTLLTALLLTFGFGCGEAEEGRSGSLYRARFDDSRGED